MRTLTFRPSLRWLALHPRRIFAAPRVEAVEAPAVGADGRLHGDVALRGVVCGVCAVRTRAALASVPGVESVEVDLDASRARVTYAAGVPADGAEAQRAMQQALERVVVGMPARVGLERGVHALRHGLGAVSRWLGDWRPRRRDR
jgi:copper chaperone CopZ